MDVAETEQGEVTGVSISHRSKTDKEEVLYTGEVRMTRRTESGSTEGANI